MADQTPEAGRLRVKGWKEFQHYKKRSPPWIRLYRGLLDNEEYWMLPVASRALAPCVWLLASESEDGSVSADAQRLAYRFRMSRAEIVEAVQPLIDHGFLIGRLLPASVVLAPRLHDATPEQSRGEQRQSRGEAEGEAETERRTDQQPGVPLACNHSFARETFAKTGRHVVCGCGEQFVPVKSNPFVGDRRPALESEFLELVRFVAEAEGDDPETIAAKAAHYDGAKRQKTNPASMSEDRLLASVLDLRAWKQQIASKRAKASA